MTVLLLSWVWNVGANGGGRVERGELIAGRYELVKRLGRGGMGEVWAGRDRNLHRDVALKLLVLDEAALPELALRFEREAVAAAQISHPNVVALHDRGLHEDVLFLVMEKVDGITLTERMRSEAPMAPARALAIADGICAALISAHRAGVVHYDIKPHNVMLTLDGRVKVVDFGIAGFLQTAFTVARSSQLTPAGTPEYGAPEQFLTERGDERSDLYALGSVLFAMLTGQPPFTGHHGLAVIRAKLDEDAPRLDSLRPGLPPALTTLVAALLDRNPAQRPQTAQHVYERLSDLREHLAPHGQVSDGPHGTAPWPGNPQDVAQPQSPAKTTVQIPSWSSSPASFEASWTGQEPVSTFAARPSVVGPWLAAVLFSSVAVASFYFPQHLGLTTPGPPGRDTPWNAVPPLGGGLGSGLALLFALSAIVRTFMRGKHALAREARSGWSLHVGPGGIATDSAAGRQEFPWEQIQRVIIEEVQGSLPYQFTGVHVDLVSGAARPTMLRPAGWLYPQPDTVRVRPTGRIPVCVLGPMTERQRTELIKAVSGYGGQRWVPAVHFTTLAADL